LNVASVLFYAGKLDEADAAGLVSPSNQCCAACAVILDTRT
jgi:hypothetical protein